MLAIDETEIDASIAAARRLSAGAIDAMTAKFFAAAAADLEDARPDWR